MQGPGQTERKRPVIFLWYRMFPSRRCSSCFPIHPFFSVPRSWRVLPVAFVHRLLRLTEHRRWLTERMPVSPGFRLLSEMSLTRRVDPLRVPGRAREGASARWPPVSSGRGLIQRQIRNHPPNRWRETTHAPGLPIPRLHNPMHLLNRTRNLRCPHCRLTCCRSSIRILRR